MDPARDLGDTSDGHGKDGAVDDEVGINLERRPHAGETIMANDDAHLCDKKTLGQPISGNY